MVYQITVYAKGVTQTIFEGIEAPDALTAIERVEAQFEKFVALLRDGDVMKEVRYTGLCFEARRLEMYLN